MTSRWQRRTRGAGLEGSHGAAASRTRRAGIPRTASAREVLAEEVVPSRRPPRAIGRLLVRTPCALFRRASDHACGPRRDAHGRGQGRGCRRRAGAGRLGVAATACPRARPRRPSGPLPPRPAPRGTVNLTAQEVRDGAAGEKILRFTTAFQGPTCLHAGRTAPGRFPLRRRAGGPLDARRSPRPRTARTASRWMSWRAARRTQSVDLRGGATVTDRLDNRAGVQLQGATLVWLDDRGIALQPARLSGPGLRSSIRYWPVLVGQYRSNGLASWRRSAPPSSWFLVGCNGLLPT